MSFWVPYIRHNPEAQMLFQRPEWHDLIQVRSSRRNFDKRALEQAVFDELKAFCAEGIVEYPLNKIVM